MNHERIRFGLQSVILGWAFTAALGQSTCPPRCLARGHFPFPAELKFITQWILRASRTGLTDRFPRMRCHPSDQCVECGESSNW